MEDPTFDAVYEAERYRDEGYNIDIDDVSSAPSPFSMLGLPAQSESLTEGYRFPSSNPLHCHKCGTFYFPDRASSRFCSTKCANSTMFGKPITHNGVTKTRVEWAKTVGISPQTLEQRLSRGWDIKRALSPVKPRQGERTCTIDGVTRTIEEWCERHGVGRQVFSWRIHHGWELVAALTTPPRKLVKA